MGKRTTLLLASAVTATFGAAEATAQTFIGQNFSASQLETAPYYRVAPFATGAAGADHFVELNNSRFSVYRKSDGVRVQTRTQNDFWAAAGAPHVGQDTMDPRMQFDPHARRWYATAVDNWPNANGFLFAVSAGPDPTGAWQGFRIDADSNDTHTAQSPAMGYNGSAVVLAANMFNVGGPGGQSSTFVVIPKSGLLAPSPTVAGATRFEELDPNSGPGFSVQPAVDMDNGSLPLPMLSALNTDDLKRSNVAGTATTPFISAPASGVIPTASTMVSPLNADQPGDRAHLFAMEGFPIARVNNTVLNNGEIWSVQMVEAGGGRAGARWYRINATSNAIIETGDISHPSLAYLYPSIAVNDLGDVVIGMSGTDPNTFASTYAVVGKTVGGVTTFGTPFQTKAGVSDYERFDPVGRNNWGWYTATTLDPADPSIFWTIQEYVHATDVWGTQVTEVIIPQPGEARWKDAANGNFAADAGWFGGAAPTNTSHAIFSRATDPAGSGYTVSFGASQTVDRLSVRQGKVTLDLAGSTITATNPSGATPGLAVGEYGGAPTLNVVGGTVIADHATLAASPTASAVVNLSGGAKLQMQCDAVGGTDTVAGGDAVLNIDGGSTLRADQMLRVWDRGVVNFNSGLMSAGLLDVTGGRVNVASAGGTKVVRTTDVQTSNGGRVDLTTNAMTVNYAPADGSPLAGVKEQIASAYAGGAWTGPGIATSAGDAGQFGLGYGEASALTTVPPVFGAVDASTVLVRFTRYGDADLNATVNLDDFNRLAANFGSTSAVWTQGDFTYDGRVNLDDFNRLAGNFGLGASGAVAPEDWAALAAAVPEPGAAASAALVMACGMMGGRRRRRAVAPRTQTA